MNSLDFKHTHSAISLFLIFSSPTFTHTQSDDSVVVIFRVLMFCFGSKEILIAQNIVSIEARWILPDIS